MLVSLYVKDFAIVGEAEINFAPGLTVVTGETGAGKSLLVDALLLIAGGRAETSSIRHGCERAELIAEFDLREATAAREWLAQEELDDQHQCQLRRVIRAEGSSKSYINGRPVTLAQLNTLGQLLIEIHGQHEHQALLERSQQLALLDAFGNHRELTAQVAQLAKRWREIGNAIRQLHSESDDPNERINQLNDQIRQLEQFALTPAELEELNHTHKRLANAGALAQGNMSLGELLDGDSEFALLRLLARAQNEIMRLSELDPRLAPVRELIDSAQIQLNEACDSLTRYQNALDLDPERLFEVEAQLAKLHELARKHRVPIAELKHRETELREAAQQLQHANESLAHLHQERQTVAVAYTQAAAQLSQARVKAAQQLSQKVTALMSDLGMNGGQFEVTLEPQTNTDPDPQGRERSEFLVSANPGQPLRPLRKTASGGELSRISLAIEVSILGLDDIGTMVFDEVDSGIGGAIAEVVGQHLRQVGGKRQALCVTHLPQVAAQAHHHLRVAKSTKSGSTETHINALDEKARQEEIARMLGGIEITRKTLAHAKQMLKQGQAETR